MSIDDFVNHRWADAKEALRKLEADFVERSENTVNLQRMGLSPPWQADGQETPMSQLPKEWHRLLEACVEIVLQRTRLQVATHGLSAVGNSDLSKFEAGKQQTYHFGSWFIYANTLAERTGDIVRRTSELYVSDPPLAKELTKRYKESVRE